MTPRQIRIEFVAGRAKFAAGRTPDPPPEWPEYRRVALQQCIRAAVLFVKLGRSVEEVGRSMTPGKKKRMPVTKQRVAKRVADGCKFLIRRKHIEIISRE